MSEVAFDTWYKSVDLEVLELQSVNVRETGKVPQVAAADFLRHEPRIRIKSVVHSEFFYKGH